jgi:SAM-dependent methyltransferase
VDVRGKVLGATDLSSARVLEIGALHNPRLRRDEGDVSYLDIAPADELRSKFQDNPKAAPYLGGLVDVDFLWRPGQSLSEAVSGRRFDLVIASHVIEHVANPIGWLAQVAELLADNGYLSLVIPDKRYCFDANRQLTTMADLVDAHLRRLEAPGARHIFDCEANFMDVTAEELWAGVDVSQRRRTDVCDPDLHAYELCVQIAATGEYRDEHCSTFTPDSFIRLFRTIVALGLSELDVDAIYPTDPGAYEFFVRLLKRPHRADRSRRVADVDAHLLDLDGVLEPRRDAPAREDDSADARAGFVMTVSDREQRWILRKRAVMSAIRSRIAQRRST